MFNAYNVLYCFGIDRSTAILKVLNIIVSRQVALSSECVSRTARYLINFYLKMNYEKSKSILIQHTLTTHKLNWFLENPFHRTIFRDPSDNFVCCCCIRFELQLILFLIYCHYTKKLQKCQWCQLCVFAENSNDALQIFLSLSPHFFKALVWNSVLNHWSAFRSRHSRFSPTIEFGNIDSVGMQSTSQK